MTLSTWLGLTEDPAVLDRYGAVPAALARQIAREAARDHPTTTTWRCIITSDDHASVLAVADPMRTPQHDPPRRLGRLVDTIHPAASSPAARAPHAAATTTTASPTSTAGRHARATFNRCAAATTASNPSA